MIPLKIEPRSRIAIPCPGDTPAPGQHGHGLAPWRRAHRVMRAVAADNRGGTVVEFAVSVSMLLTLMMVIIEIGLILLTVSLMEGGLRDAARFGITGQGADADERLALILDHVERSTVGMVDMDRAEFEVLVYPSFSDVGRGEPYLDANGNGRHDSGETYTDENGNGSFDEDIGEDGPGTAGDIVVYRMRYPWEFTLAIAAEALGYADGILTIGASIVVRNEPWEDAPIGGT